MLQPFASDNNPSDFPIAYKYQNEILSLPMFPELNNDQIKYVTNSIKGFFDCL